MDGCLCFGTLCLEGVVLEGCLSCDDRECGWDSDSEVSLYPG